MEKVERVGNSIMNALSDTVDVEVLAAIGPVVRQSELRRKIQMASFLIHDLAFDQYTTILDCLTHHFVDRKGLIKKAVSIIKLKRGDEVPDSFGQAAGVDVTIGSAVTEDNAIVGILRFNLPNTTSEEQV